MCDCPARGQREWVAVAVLRVEEQRPTRSRRRTRRSLGCPGSIGPAAWSPWTPSEAAAAVGGAGRGGALAARRAAGERDHCRQGTMGVVRQELVDVGAGWAKAVWKSKFYGAFVLNRRVVPTPSTRRRHGVGAGSSPLDRARTAASSPRNLVKNCRVHPTHWSISHRREVRAARRGAEGDSRDRQGAVGREGRGDA